jgi:hypothetical protein
MCLKRLKGVMVVTTLVLLGTNCGLRHVRIISRGQHPATTTPLTASKADLEKRVLDLYNALQSFTSTVDLVPSLGSVYKGKITDYQDVTAYIDFQKQDHIRVVGLMPVVHTTAFQMVSDGKEFRVYIPIKNRFIQGSNDAPAASPNKLENIRPEMFLSAMLVKPPDPEKDRTTLEDDTTESNSLYHLNLNRELPNHEMVLIRRITFDRVNLQIVEQREYDPQGSGSIVGEARYSDWQIYDNIRFPSRIEIARPKDEYGVTLAITKMEMNKPLPENRFVLERPEGSQLQVIGATDTQPKSPAKGIQ